MKNTIILLSGIFLVLCIFSQSQAAPMNYIFHQIVDERIIGQNHGSSHVNSYGGEVDYDESIYYTLTIDEDTFEWDLREYPNWPHYIGTGIWTYTSGGMVLRNGVASYWGDEGDGYGDLTMDGVQWLTQGLGLEYYGTGWHVGEIIHFHSDDVGLDALLITEISAYPVPEPATMMLFSIGLLTLTGIYRKNL